MSSWEEAREDPSCVVPQCDEARCVLWRCQDLVEVDEAPPAVVLARGPMPQAMRPPLVGTPDRWWGRTLAAPIKTKRIDIHAFTISLPKSVHQRLHSGEPKGGQWNAAWRQFRDENKGATAEDVWQFAFELMWRFGVSGPLTPYYCQG